MDGLSLLDIPLLSAQSLGDYQLIAEIGRGGMANVYLALTPSVNGGAARSSLSGFEKRSARRRRPSAATDAARCIDGRGAPFANFFSWRGA